MQDIQANDIQGKVIAISGASSGIGEATARLLAERGAKLMLGARRTDRLEKLVAEIEAAGGTARFQALDVTDRNDFERFIVAAVDAFGRIDVLVNNAGVMPLSPYVALKVDEWDRMVDVNIKGVLYGIAAALPRMKAQGSGQFVNISVCPRCPRRRWRPAARAARSWSVTSRSAAMRLSPSRR